MPFLSGGSPKSPKAGDDDASRLDTRSGAESHVEQPLEDKSANYASPTSPNSPRLAQQARDPGQGDSDGSTTTSDHGHESSSKDRTDKVESTSKGKASSASAAPDSENQPPEIKAVLDRCKEPKFLEHLRSAIHARDDRDELQQKIFGDPSKPRIRTVEITDYLPHANSKRCTFNTGNCNKIEPGDIIWGWVLEAARSPNMDKNHPNYVETPHGPAILKCYRMVVRYGKGRYFSVNPLVTKEDGGYTAAINASEGIIHIEMFNEGEYYVLHLNSIYDPLFIRGGTVKKGTRLYLREYHVLQDGPIEKCDTQFPEESVVRFHDMVGNGLHIRTLIPQCLERIHSIDPGLVAKYRSMGVPQPGEWVERTDHGAVRFSSRRGSYPMPPPSNRPMRSPMRTAQPQQSLANTARPNGRISKHRVNPNNIPLEPRTASSVYSAIARHQAEGGEVGTRYSSAPSSTSYQNRTSSRRDDPVFSKTASRWSDYDPRPQER